MVTRKHPKLWALVVDGEHARVVGPTVSRGQFATLFELDSTAAHLRSSDMGSERLGRVRESVGAAHHAVEPRHDPHRQAKHDFVTDVARQVAAHAAEGAFERLVLVAPAHALHDLRAALPEAVREKVVAELEKDLVKVPDGDLGEHLADWWVAPPSQD